MERKGSRRLHMHMVSVFLCMCWTNCFSKREQLYFWKQISALMFQNCSFTWSWKVSATLWTPWRWSSQGYQRFVKPDRVDLQMLCFLSCSCLIESCVSVSWGIPGWWRPFASVVPDIPSDTLLWSLLTDTECSCLESNLHTNRCYDDDEHKNRLSSSFIYCTCFCTLKLLFLLLLCVLIFHFMCNAVFWESR